MKKKLLALFLLAGLMLPILTACGGEAQTAAESPAASASAASSGTSETPEPASQPPAETPSAPEEGPAAPSEAAPEESEAPPAYEMLALPFEEPVTITIWDVFPPPLVGFMDGPWDCTANRVLEEATNTKFAYTSVSTETAAEQFGLMVVSGVLCDFIYGVGDFYSGGPDLAIEDDIIIDLKEMAECVPNYQTLIGQFPDAYELTAEGNMYRFPMIEVEQFNDRLQGLTTRGDWLEALGMEPPQTYDEFYEMLAAFQTTYGGGTFLLDASGFSPTLGSGFGVSGDFYQVDGQVKYGPAEEGYQDYAEFVARLYAEDMIYSDFMTLVGPPSAPIGTGEVGVWACDVGMWAFFTSGITTEGYYAQGFANPTVEPGEKTHFAEIDSVISEGMSISTACEQLDVMATIVNYLYSDEFAIPANYGVEGEGLVYNEAGQPQLSDLVLNNTETITSFAVKKYSLFTQFPHQDIQTRFMPCYDEVQLETLSLWADSQDALYTLPADLNLSMQDEDTLSRIMSDVETHVDEMLLSFITGAADLAGFDTYVSDLYAMGLQEAIDIYQAALDTYNA